jgi:hypothetical protein
VSEWVGGRKDGRLGRAIGEKTLIVKRKEKGVRNALNAPEVPPESVATKLKPSQQTLGSSSLLDCKHVDRCLLARDL